MLSIDKKGLWPSFRARVRTIRDSLRSTPSKAGDCLATPYQRGGKELDGSVKAGGDVNGMAIFVMRFSIDDRG